jgi:hypothetical protein
MKKPIAQAKRRVARPAATRSKPPLGAAALETLRLPKGAARHEGTVRELGRYDWATPGRYVVIDWDEVGVVDLHGGITDEQWEVFKLAFSGSGRVAILSDKEDAMQWVVDFRILGAVRELGNRA